MVGAQVSRKGKGRWRRGGGFKTMRYVDDSAQV